MLRQLHPGIPRLVVYRTQFKPQLRQNCTIQDRFAFLQTLNKINSDLRRTILQKTLDQQNISENLVEVDWAAQDTKTFIRVQNELSNHPNIHLSHILRDIIESLKAYTKFRTKLAIVNSSGTNRTYSPEIRYLYEASIKYASTEMNLLKLQFYDLESQAEISCVSRQVIRNLIRTTCTIHSARISGCESIISAAKTKKFQQYADIMKRHNLTVTDLLNKITTGQTHTLPEELAGFIREEILGPTFSDLKEKYLADNCPEQAFQKIIANSQKPNKIVSDRKDSANPYFFVFEFFDVFIKTQLNFAFRNLKHVILDPDPYTKPIYD